MQKKISIAIMAGLLLFAAFNVRFIHDPDEALKVWQFSRIALVIATVYLWLVLATKTSKLVYLTISAILIIFGYYCFKWQEGIDFECYFLAAKSFFAHTRPYLNLYSKQGFLYYYPPLTAELIWPFTFLGLQGARAIWFIFSAAATAAGVYLLIDNKRDFSCYLIWAFSFFPVLVTLYTGQVNCFLFLALCLGYRGLIKNKIWQIGWGIAVGIMLKWLPLAHFCYLFWRRKYKAFLTVVIALILLFLLELPFAGWRDWQDFFHLLKQFGTPALPHQGLDWELAFNQAFSGLTVRFTHHQSVGLFWAYILDILIVLATAFLCWPKGNGQKILALEFSSVTIAVNLIMPYAWYYQYTILIIPLIILLQDIKENTKIAQYKNKQLIMIWIGFLLTDLYAPIQHWRFLLNPFLTSFPTFFAILLWVLIAKRLVSLKFFKLDKVPVFNQG